jgi:ubiquinone/menaquinone biosynthesis C-methylase UbiE
LCIDRDESANDRAHVGDSLTHLVCDAAELPFESNTLDYVFSSHCLEDADDTKEWLREWLRVIRPGGNLVLFLPDQQAYVAHCKASNSLPNQAHKHDDFSLQYVIDCLMDLGVGSSQMESVWPFEGNPYSFSLVVRKQ